MTAPTPADPSFEMRVRESFDKQGLMATLGASILAVGYVIPLVYFAYSLVAGEKSVNDPWGARGLEWEIPSPPPTENFSVSPIVTGSTHQYTHGSQEVGLA